MTSALAHSANIRDLDRMFREHNSWLLRWVRSRSRSDLIADEVASEVYLRLLTMDDLAAIREPRAMMTTIARNIMTELFRRSRLRRSYEAELAALPEQSVASPEHQLIIIETLRALDRILSSMSRKARTAFLLSQVDGLKYAEIAGELGVSVSMVRKYVAQGFMLFLEHHPDRD